MHPALAAFHFLFWKGGHSVGSDYSAAWRFDQRRRARQVGRGRQVGSNDAPPRRPSPPTEKPVDSFYCAGREVKNAPADSAELGRVGPEDLIGLGNLTTFTA